MTTQTIHAPRTLRAAPQTSRSPLGDVAAQVAAVRQSQRSWAQTDIEQRLKFVRRLRNLLAEHAEQLAKTVKYPARNSTAETLAAEIIPLADACRFLERHATRLLAPRTLSRRSRPIWLRGVSVELRRDPFGVILIVGASNYPLFLPGVQAIQALVAGNGVVIKPAVASSEPAAALAELLIAAGFDSQLIQLLPEQNDSVERAVDAGIDKVVLTGSANTGRQVQSLLAKSLTPSVMELSGCDAVFVLPGAQLDRVVQSLMFGLRFNGSATCIAPRRILVLHDMKAQLERRLRTQTVALSSEGGDQGNHTRAADLVNDALRRGARIVAGGTTQVAGRAELLTPTVVTDVDATMPILSEDIFAPVICLVPVASVSEALSVNEECPYALGATIFGGRRHALEVAAKVNAGCVVINDMIAPTADPRTPFGGRRKSGFGVTRGAAGLEELTQLKSIVLQRSGWLPHLNEPTPFDANLLAGFLRMSHGASFRQKVLGLRSVMNAIMDQRSWKRNDTLSGGSKDVTK